MDETLAGDLRDDDSGLAQADADYRNRATTGRIAVWNDPGEADTMLVTADGNELFAVVTKRPDAQKIERLWNDVTERKENGNDE